VAIFGHGFVRSLCTECKTSVIPDPIF
jgi:hypothetical protein